MSNTHFYRINCTLERMENTINEMKEKIEELELSVKGSIDYNDFFIPVSKDKIKKLGEKEN